MGFALGAGDDEEGKINPLAGMGLTDERGSQKRGVRTFPSTLGGTSLTTFTVTTTTYAYNDQEHMKDMDFVRGCAPSSSKWGSTW